MPKKQPDATTSADSEKRPRGRPGPPPISLAPMTVDEALAAMLRTPPPPAEKKEPKKTRAKKRKAR